MTWGSDSALRLVSVMLRYFPMSNGSASTKVRPWAYKEDINLSIEQPRLVSYQVELLEDPESVPPPPLLGAISSGIPPRVPPKFDAIITE